MNFGATINGAGRQMPPRGFGHEANARDHLWKDGIGGHHLLALTLGQVAVGVATMTCGVDEEKGPHCAQVIEKEIETGVIESLACQWDEGMSAPSQLACEGSAEVTAGT
jgi:hypothetical protein